jgi:hypothetical protein
MSRSLPYRLHGISIHIAKDRHGREDESTGAVALGSLKGDALANALMECETKAKRRVTLSLAGLGWLDETELATIPGAQVGEPNGDQPPAETISHIDPDHEAGHENGAGEREPLPTGKRLTPDQARELKKLAQTAFGYAEGERRLRHDLGFEPDERLTLRHLAAHVTADQYHALTAAYRAALGQQADVDVP